MDMMCSTQARSTKNIVGKHRVDATWKILYTLKYDIKMGLKVVRRQGVGLSCLCIGSSGRSL